MNLKTYINSALATLGALSLALVAPIAAYADEDPNLVQTVNADETISTDTVAISRGHIDIGPRLRDGQWTVMARHDAENGATWYDADNVVIQVVEAAVLPTPEGDDYAFLNDSASWYVIPQTENPAVTWLGWNTQDPEITHHVKRGVTMSIGPVEGPGRSVLFLQDGTFGQPRVLMDSAVEGSQDIWVDVNTHVHANWAFSQPGVYRAAVAFTAETTDGQTLTETATLRFAVGDNTDPASALELPALHVASPADKPATNLSTHTENAQNTQGDTGYMWWIVAGLLVVVAVIVGVSLAVHGRSRQEAAQAEAEHQRFQYTPHDGSHHQE